MIRLFLLLILLFTVATSNTLNMQNLCTNDIDEFTPHQKATIKKAYEYGSKHGLGSTLAAIAWQESCAGVYLVNFQDPSAGVFHAYIPNILKKYKNLRDNGFTANMVGQKLINDFDFSAKEAINELLYWKGIHSGNLENMIKSYNKGFSWQKQSSAASKAQSYYTSVASKSKAVENFIRGSGDVKSSKMYVADTEPLKLPLYSTPKKSSPTKASTPSAKPKAPKNNNVKELNELAKFIMIEY